MTEIKDCFSVLIPSLALSIALYTFFSNNAKFKEFAKRLFFPVVIQLCSIILCSVSLVASVIEHLITAYNNLAATATTPTTGIPPATGVNPDTLAVFGSGCLFVAALLYAVSWLILLRIFYSIYGNLYHMRRKRFLKYTKPVLWLHERFFHNADYEEYHIDRSLKSAEMLGITRHVFSKVSSGGCILLLYDDLSDYRIPICQMLSEAICNGETADYVITYCNPIEICNIFSLDNQTQVAESISFIDCFTTHYSFDDKVLKQKMSRLKREGYQFYSAYSFSDVHTACNDSWYRFAKQLSDREKGSPKRRPHRTIYDTLSSLIVFSSLEVYLTFFRHVISSEKEYGMISLIAEPYNLDDSIKNEIVKLADIVVRCTSEGVSLYKQSIQ